ncbi:Fibroblast growth factor receptor-like 1 [Dinothrombium tinctorium]|uniref:receptor protein-tyrosine kinase n=1 Tax=Dinothrombium tinctorium TaxID=1965070 RepID=A0A3S3P048_9ACAR|nr:Fibroblast growth factor receptor-like 1 [Dinothrombium tinctorium]RWS08425.1 Fibroblast growth factor receptor-like 1 [Dinothrombium tinctorium]
MTKKIQKQPIIYPIGATVVLQCPVESDTTMFVEWFRHNEPVDEIGKYKITTRGFLRFKNAAAEDSGIYVCKAINGFGFTKANVTIAVLRQSELISMKTFDDNRYPRDPLFGADLPPAEAIQMVRNIEKDSGKCITLKCNMPTVPVQKTSWLKDGEPIDVSSLPVGSQINFSAMFLSKLRPEDSGLYVCIAYTEYGQRKTSFAVKVRESKFSKPELIVSQPVKSPIKVGDTVTFQCKVESQNKPHIRWLKQCDEKSLQNLKREPVTIDGERYISLNSYDVHQNGVYKNILKIKNVQPHDSGKYICLAANTRGYSYKSVQLLVSVPEEQKEAIRTSDHFSIAFICVMIVITLVILTVCFILYLIAKASTANENCSEEHLRKSCQKSTVPNEYTYNDHVSQWLCKNHGHPGFVQIESSSHNDSAKTHVTAITL